MEENCITLGLLVSAIQRNSVITEYQAELPVLYGNFPLAGYFTQGNVFISMLLSQSTFLPEKEQSEFWLQFQACVQSSSTVTDVAVVVIRAEGNCKLLWRL